MWYASAWKLLKDETQIAWKSLPENRTLGRALADHIVTKYYFNMGFVPHIFRYGYGE